MHFAFWGSCITSIPKRANKLIARLNCTHQVVAFSIKRVPFTLALSHALKEIMDAVTLLLSVCGLIEKHERLQTGCGIFAADQRIYCRVFVSPGFINRVFNFGNETQHRRLPSQHDKIMKE